MHRLPHRSAVVRFRLASLFIVLAMLLILSAVILLLAGMVRQINDWVLIGGIFIGTALLLLLIQWIMSSRARCPLCVVQPLQRRACSKHREARRLLGSYRLRVALSILFRGWFRCPYCNEPTAMEVRQRGQR